MREPTSHHSVCSGNFGTVRLAVLRRRGKSHPARLVAVKELKEEASDCELMNEARLMQDIPYHQNVVYLFGVTDSPFCLVSQLIPDAAELQVIKTHTHTSLL